MEGYAIICGSSAATKFGVALHLFLTMWTEYDTHRLFVLRYVL